jgi:hypothetical protein
MRLPVLSMLKCPCTLPTRLEYMDGAQIYRDGSGLGTGPYYLSQVFARKVANLFKQTHQANFEIRIMSALR